MRAELVVLLLAVAATAPSRAYAAAESEGFALARLVINANLVGGSFRWYSSISLENEAKERVRLETTQPDNPMTHLPRRPTHLLGGRLPPGRYAVTGVEVNLGATGTGLSIRGQLPSFTVAAGAVTDLGMLIVQPVASTEATVIPIRDRPMTLSQVRANFSGEADLLTATAIDAPDLSRDWKLERVRFGDIGTNAGLVIDLIVGSGNKRRAEDARAAWASVSTLADAVAFARASTVALSRPTVGPDGATYFGTTLGQVLVRTAAGKWSGLQVDPALGGVTTTAFDGPLLVVGTDNGDLLRGPLPTGPFVPVPSPGRGMVQDVYELPNGEWLVTYDLNGPKELETSVFLGPEITELGTAPSRTVSLKRKGSAWDATLPRTFAVGSRSGYLLTKGGDEPADFYSATRRTWESVKSGTKLPSFVYSGEGLVQRIDKEGQLATTNPDFISSDGGQTWAKFDGEGSRNRITRLFDASTAITIDAGIYGRSQVVRSTTDGGKAWRDGPRLDGVPCAPETIRAIEAQRLAICIFRDGTIRSVGMSGDWTLER